MFKGLRSAVLIIAMMVVRPALGAEPTTPRSPLPPLTEPPTHEVLTGKFVWGDLFTSDVELSRAFYERLFGWQWVVISEPPRSYGMLYADGVPVAGIVHRPPATGTAGYGRWVHYVSVEDVSTAHVAPEVCGPGWPFLVADPISQGRFCDRSSL